MVWLTERGVFALLRLDMDYFAAMYSYTITFGPVTLRTSDPSDQCPFGPVTCNLHSKCFYVILSYFTALCEWNK